MWSPIVISSFQITIVDPDFQAFLELNSPEIPIVPRLYEAFPPAEAGRIAAKLEWHYTPEHGYWLNLAECELSVLARQCLNRRLPDKETLIPEVAAWEQKRNVAQVTIHWQFTTQDARIKLRRLYPVIKEQNST